MSIQQLDMKILWGKANGRCALCPKKEKVVIETAENKGRTDILFGDMCHIIGDKEEAARGVSAMPEEDRDRYHNLILLCKNHHAQIDKDVATYTVEKLHQIKTDHELWIDSRLDEELGLEDSLYSKLVNLISDQLQLHRWSSVSNGAINRRLPIWFIEGVDVVGQTLHRTNWPNKDPDIEKAIKNLGNHLGVFVGIFMSNSQLDRWSHFYVDVKGYRDHPSGSEAQERAKEAYGAWEKDSGEALCNFVLALNEFAEAVRKRLNPKFFFLEGKFSISDQLGVTNEMVPTEIIPREYFTIKQ